MSIAISTNTKAKATLKLYNQLVSYMFEQEFDELKYANQSNIKTLRAAQKALSMIINRAKSKDVLIRGLRLYFRKINGVNDVCLTTKVF